MQKRPWLVAAAALGLLGLAFHLHGLAANHGFSARALIGRAGLRPVLYRLLAVLPRPAVVMLGDSITAGADWNTLLPSFDVANRGIPGDTTDGVLGRIDNIVAVHPRCVAVMIGVNDLSGERSGRQVLRNYAAIVDRLNRNGSTVIVQSTLLTSHPSLDTSVIEVDRALAEMCRQSGRCLYLDLNSTVASTGALPDSIDGLHLGPNSYKLRAL